MWTDWLQTGSLFFLAILNCGLLAANLRDREKLNELERRVKDLER